MLTPEEGTPDTSDPRGARFTPAVLARRLCRPLPPSLRHGEPPRFLDPACGRGELLLAAWEAAGRSERVAAEGLFGIEIDPELCRQVRARLRRAIGGEAGRRAATHVLEADALDPAVPWPEATHVLANPPWVSLSGRQAWRSLSTERRRLYRESWRSLEGWPSLHGAFLERIAGHVAAQGSSARVLLPASVCELDGYAALRRQVTARAKLPYPPLELGEEAFPGVTEPAVLLELAARGPGGRGSGAPWSRLDPRYRGLIHRLAGFPRLPERAFGDPGVHTGNCAAELVLRGAAAGAAGLAGLREGRDLSAYRLGPPRALLRVDLPRSPPRRFRIKPRESYEAFPVLLRQTADRPIAALHAEPTFFRNSLLGCTPPEGLDPAFVVAVLNAPVAAAWHRLSFRDARQRAFPQVKVAHLRSQPFPIAHRDEAPELHDRIARQVRSSPEGLEGAERRALEALLTEAFSPSPGEERSILELAAGRGAAPSSRG